jgi:thioredoxin-like negative regulator of GroEL
MTPAPTTLERPRLLFFYSPTCGASRRAEALLGHVLQHKRNHETFVVHRVDVKARPDLAARFAVEGTPALYVVEGNRVIVRGQKPRTIGDLKELLGPWLRKQASSDR